VWLSWGQCDVSWLCGAGGGRGSVPGGAERRGTLRRSGHAEAPSVRRPGQPFASRLDRLPPSGTTILGKLVFTAGLSRRSRDPQDVIGCLVLRRAPRDAAGLLLLIGQTAVQARRRPAPSRFMIDFLARPRFG